MRRMLFFVEITVDHNSLIFGWSNSSCNNKTMSPNVHIPVACAIKWLNIWIPAAQPILLLIQD